MLQVKQIAFLGLASLAIACNNKPTEAHKKVMVLYKGTPKVEAKTYSISITDAPGSAEQVFEYATPQDKQLTVNGNAQTLTDKGYYIFNARKDTIVGSYQNYGKATAGGVKEFTEGQVFDVIDSLSLLVAGKNVSAANKNFFIAPNSLTKITDNTDAFIVAPFHQVTTMEKPENGKELEVYRFWTVTEIRERIVKMKKALEPKPSKKQNKNI